MNRISDEERAALRAEARKLAERAKLTTNPTLRAACDAERDALEAERKRRTVCIIEDEDDPNVHHVGRGRPSALIIPFPTNRRRAALTGLSKGVTIDWST